MSERSERHSFGTSWGCLGRRMYVLLFCCVMTVVCLVQTLRWAGRWHVLDALVGNSWQPAHSPCVGTDCYDVWTCFGLKDATQHVREPLASVSGLLIFPVAAHAVQMGYQRPVKFLGVYLTVSAIVHFALIISDLIYFQACNGYASNIIMQTLMNTVLPPSPFTLAARAELQKMTVYPVATVDTITKNFPSLTWYIVWATLWASILAYTAWEATLLGDLVERGPLGLGIHYGLDQWDQVISHADVRRHKEREMRSQFLDDARVLNHKRILAGPDAEMPLGYRAAGYGATATNVEL